MRLRARFEAIDDDSKDAVADADAALEAINAHLGNAEDIDRTATVAAGTEAEDQP